MPFYDAQSAYRYLSQTASGAAAANPSVISRLNPTYAVNLANAIEAARAQGMNVGVGSAYRSPGYLAAQQRAAGKPLSLAARFDATGDSLHSYGIATDIYGLTDKNGHYVPALAKKFADIARPFNVYQPYGPNNPSEANHFQAVPYKGATPALRATLNADGTPKLNANGQPLYWSAANLANPVSGAPPLNAPPGGSNIPKVMQTLMQGDPANGINPMSATQAASVLGNMRVEAPTRGTNAKGKTTWDFNNVDPNATGDQGTAHSLGQWHGDRWTNAQKVAANYSDPLTGYTLAYSKELQASPAWARLQNLPDTAAGVQQGTQAIMAGFERPSAKAQAQSIAQRNQYALEAYNRAGEPAAPPNALVSPPALTPAQQAIQNVTNPPGGTLVAPVSPRDYALGRGGAVPGGPPAPAPGSVPAPVAAPSAPSTPRDYRSDPAYRALSPAAKAAVDRQFKAHPEDIPPAPTGAAPGGPPAPPPGAPVAAPAPAPAVSSRTDLPRTPVPALGPGTTPADTGPAGMAQRVAAINPGLGRLGAGVPWSTAAGALGGVPAAASAAGVTAAPPAIPSASAAGGAPPAPVAPAEEAYQSRAPVPVMPGVGALPALPYGAEAVLKAQYNNDPKALAAATDTIKNNVIAQHGYMGALLHQDAIKKEITDALGQATLADPVLGNQIKDNVASNPALTRNADPAGLAAMKATFAKLRPVTPTGSIPLPVARPDYTPPPAADTTVSGGVPAAPSATVAPATTAPVAAPGAPVTPQQEAMARANRGWSAVQGSMAPPPPNRIPHIPDTLVRQTPDTLARRFADAFAPEPVPATVVPGTDITPAEYDPRQAPVRNLTVGMSGPDVMQVQNQLRALGFNPGAADGVYGPQTRAAVLRAQKAVDPKGYAGPNDGVAGLWTQGMLNRLLSSPAYGAAGARGLQEYTGGVPTPPMRPVPTDMSGPNIYGQPGGTVPLQPFSRSPAYGAAAARGLQGYPGLNFGFVTGAFSPNTNLPGSPNVGGAGIPFSTAAATPPGPPVGFGGRDFGNYSGSTGRISFGGGSPYGGTSADYSGALANAVGGGGSGAPFSGSGGYVPVGVGGGPDDRNNVMGGLLGGYGSAPAPGAGAAANAVPARSMMAGLIGPMPNPAADEFGGQNLQQHPPGWGRIPGPGGFTPVRPPEDVPANQPPDPQLQQPHLNDPRVFGYPPTRLAGLIGPMPNPAPDDSGGQNRLPGAAQPPGWGRIPFNGIYPGSGFFPVRPPEAVPDIQTPDPQLQPRITDPRSFGYRPTLAQNQATGGLANVLSGLFGVSPAEAAEAPAARPAIPPAVPAPPAAAAAAPSGGPALVAPAAASVNPFDAAANAPAGAEALPGTASSGVVITSSVPAAVGPALVTRSVSPSDTAPPSGGPPSGNVPTSRVRPADTIPAHLVPTAPITPQHLYSLIGGGAGSLLGPIGSIVGALLGRGLAGGAASVGTPYQGAKSADYGLASGTSSWGTPTYTASGSAYSNSPFTPAGWTAPSYDTISGGPTYAYHRDPNTGTLSWINSAGNVVTADSTSTTGAGAY